MRWPQPYRMPKWILSAAAMGMLAAPFPSFGQSAVSPSTGKPIVKPAARPATRSPQRTAPVAPPAEEANVAQMDAMPGETAVQRELRRLYNESGREAPDVPTPEQMQRINGQSNLTPIKQPMPPYGSSAAAPAHTGEAPVASAPVRTTSRNPVVSFFQRLVPGSKPVTRSAPPAPITRQAPPPPAVARQTPQPSQNYAPYSGTQPKRLPEQGARPANVAAIPKTAPAPVLPPPPVNLAEQLELNPVVTTSALPVTAAPVVAQPPTTGPVITGPSTPAPAVVARPVEEEEAEPVFESPIIVGAEPTEASPFEEPLIVESESETPAAVVEAPVAGDEFPNPFPEDTEVLADKEEMESPFSGLALDEEDPIVAQPVAVEAAPATEAPSEPAPLSVPQVAMNTAPAPVIATIETEAATTEEATTPAEALPTNEDPEFFPADVPQPAVVAKPVEVVKPTETLKPTSEPLLTLPGEPVIAQPTTLTPQEAEYAAKMQRVKERGGMKGLKGFCPVMLRDERELKDAKPEFHSQYRGQKFHFASAEAKAKFDQSPAGYAPAAYGADVVVLIRDKDVAEGTLDFAAWYKGQLYLFSSEETYTAFTNDPPKFATPAGLE